LLAACGGCDDASNLRVGNAGSEQADAAPSEESSSDASAPSHVSSDAGDENAGDAAELRDAIARSDSALDADAPQVVEGDASDASLSMSPSSPVNKFQRTVALDEETPVGTARALLDVVVGTYSGVLVNGGDFTGAGSGPSAALGPLRVEFSLGNQPSAVLDWTRDLNDHQLTVTVQMAWQATEAGLSATGPVQIKLGREVVTGDRLAQVTGSFALSDVQGGNTLPAGPGGGTVDFQGDWFVNTRIVATMIYHFADRADRGGGNSKTRLERLE
jgi:hypothetical protein